MLNKFSLSLAAAAIVLSAGATDAASLTFGSINNHGRSGTALSFDIGSVAFGYSDGYWDNSHRWHKWRNHSEYQNYRSHGQNYHSGRHDRAANNGWMNR